MSVTYLKLPRSPDPTAGSRRILPDSFAVGIQNCVTIKKFLPIVSVSDSSSFFVMMSQLSKCSMFVEDFFGFYL
jgi:hypothetical protein